MIEERKTKKEKRKKKKVVNIMSIYKRMPSDMLVMLIWSIFAFVAVLMYDNSMFRTILGMSAVLFIPGYVLVGAIFPKRDDLYIVERITLSMVMSIIVVSFLGLMLNFTFGIGMLPVVTTLFIFEIIAIFVVIYRRNKLSIDERFSVSFHEIYCNIIDSLNMKTTKNGLLTAILIFVIVVFVGTIYLSFITPNMGERFTEFYILNSESRTDSFLTDLKVDNSYDYLIGIVNYEYVPVNYTVRVALDEDVLASESVTLNYGDIWENNVTFSPDKEGKNMQLEFWLFKNDDFKEPYRRLYLWVNSTRSV